MPAPSFFLLFSLFQLSFSACYRSQQSNIPRKLIGFTNRSTETCRSFCTLNPQCEATLLNRTQTGCILLGAELPLSGGCPSSFTAWVKTNEQCCPDLLYLTSGQATSQGVSLDTTQKMEIVNDVQQFRCSSGSSFAFIDKTNKFQSPDWWLQCEDLGVWRVMSGATPGGLYEDVPVGCIKPTTCIAAEPFMYVFDGTEQIFTDIPQYILTRNYTTYVDGKFQMACPTGSSICYINREPRFIFDPLMRIQCDANGWMVYQSGSVTGALQPVKIGCCQKVD